MIKVADPELSLEQEQEEYEDFPDPFADWPQEDQVEFLTDLTQEDQVEFQPEQLLLFQKRFKEKYDPVHPTAQPVQKKPLGRSSEVGDAVSHQRDVFHNI